MTTILQWIYDIFTILTNFIVLISPNAIADILLKICNLFSIVFIMSIAYLLYDWATNKTKNPIIQISCFGVFITIMAFFALIRSTIPTKNYTVIYARTLFKYCD